MSTDDRVKSATAHWGPRFVANGVSLTDFEEVTASISNWDDWCQAWSERALVHEELGEDAHNRKKFLTAGEHLQRAGIYYHFASFLFVHDIPQMRRITSYNVCYTKLLRALGALTAVASAIVKSIRT